jgi:predicted ATPase
MLRLFKDEKDKNGNLLVDEGFGITKLIATLINIEYAILTSDSNIAIEEPENHLHPKYQSLLAEMFVDAHKNYGINFIIETHSEYLIRKLQTLVAKKELKPNEVSLQYVYDASPENRPKGEPHVKNIAIRPDGTLQEPFGPGFFDEADNLAMDLLTIKAMS